MNLQNPDRSRRIQRILQEPPISALAGVAAFVWLIRYFTKFGAHLSSPPWWVNHFDQGHYIASAWGFAHGNLSPTLHWYPLAYSLVAAPFVWIIPNEPFFIPDLALFVATALIFSKVMRRLGLSASGAVLIFLVGDMAVSKIARLWTEPWTTSLSAPLIWGLIGQTLSIVDGPIDRPPPTMRSMVALGLLAAALPLVRPTDAPLGILAVMFAITALWRQRRFYPPQLAWIVAGGLALCLPYGLLHLAIYGPKMTDYARAAANSGFVFADLPWKAYVILVSATPWFPKSPSIIEAMPWVIPGAAGLGLAWVYGDRRARVALSLISILAVPYCLVFLAYGDLQPPGVWYFENAHYFKWLFPLLAVGAWLWLRQFANSGGARRAIVALAIALLPCVIRPLPALVSDTTPARMLLFHGATNGVWARKYFSHATITDGQGSMANVSRFHQVPDKYGERALAVSRLFAGSSFRRDPNEAPPYRDAQQPYARYAVRLSVGIPCWLKRQSACRIAPPSEG